MTNMFGKPVNVWNSDESGIPITMGDSPEHQFDWRGGVK
jgi:hypothetical protein